MQLQQVQLICHEKNQQISIEIAGFIDGCKINFFYSKILL